MRQRQAGAALLLALAMLSLVAVLAVALLWEARASVRQQRYSVPVWEARQLSDFSAQTLVAHLREETRRTADELPPVPGADSRRFRPKTAADMPLARDLPTDWIDEPGARNVLRVSHRSALSADLAASPLPLSGALNLNAAELLPPDAVLPADQLDWLLLTREGPLPGIDELLPEMRRRSGDPLEVIGRVAYVIHDLSGRLDANVLADQFPQHLLTPQEQAAAEIEASRKGHLQYAQLGLIPAFAEATHSPARLPELFLAKLSGDPLRIAADGRSLPAVPGTWSHWSAYTNGVRTALPVGTTDVSGHRFLSRADLLSQAAQMDTAGLTTFSRGRLRTGDFRPGTPAALADLPPFSLHHLHLLAFNFPASPADDPQRQAAIREAFGLDRTHDGEAWEYQAVTPFLSDHFILTLDEVLKLDSPRAPNFFEMLKAALEPQSLGQFTKGTANRKAWELDQMPDVQVLKIGANIIDQWDADSFPTRIGVSHSALPHSRLEIAGIENLPLIHRVHFDCINPMWGARDVEVEDRRLLPYLFPELWNPHQPIADNATQPGSASWRNSNSPQAGPRRLRFRLLGGLIVRMRQPTIETVGTRPDIAQNLIFAGTTSGLELTDDVLTHYGPLPRLIRQAGATGLFANSQLLMPFSPSQAAGPAFPGTNFAAARLVGDASNLDMGLASLSAAPYYLNCRYILHEGIQCHVREVKGGIDELPQPYFGVSAKKFPAHGEAKLDGKIVSVFYDWTTEATADARDVMELVFPESTPFDLALEFEDHRGNWQVYNRFASANLAETAPGGIHGPEDEVAIRLFDGIHLDRDPDAAELATYLDTSGSGTFFKADPRTSRLGIAAAEDQPGSELPLPLLENPVTTPHSPGRGLQATTLRDVDLGDQSGTGLMVFNSEEFWFLPKIYWPRHFPALLAENLDWSGVDADQAKFETFARDRDGVTRPADGWMLRHLVNTRASLPPGEVGGTTWAEERAAFSPATNQAAFPVILNRPFRSLMELGAVFRDQPWKTLDLHSPKSADTGLLRYFTLHSGTPAGNAVVRQGVLDLDAADDDTLVALLTGTEIAPPQRVYSWAASPLSNPAHANVVSGRTVEDFPRITLTEADARLIVEEFRATRVDNPAVDPADLITRLALANGGAAGTTLPPLFDPDRPTARGIHPQSGDLPEISAGESTPFSVIDHEREAPLKALADIQQTGMWTVFIDLLVESGSYPQTASELTDFQARSRHRTWHRVAIDRFTGEVFDWQKEAVYE